jgi:hypothetical protein
MGVSVMRTNGHGTFALAAFGAALCFTLPAFGTTYIEERVIIQDDPGGEVALPYAPPPGVIIEHPAPPLVVTEEDFGPPVDYGSAPPPPFIDVYVGE